MLQSPYSLESPEQGSPPLAGAGSVHVLDLEYLPLPQVKVQDPHDPHADQAPSTENHQVKHLVNYYDRQEDAKHNLFLLVIKHLYIKFSAHDVLME